MLLLTIFVCLQVCCALTTTLVLDIHLAEVQNGATLKAIANQTITHTHQDPFPHEVPPPAGGQWITALAPIIACTFFPLSFMVAADIRTCFVRGTQGYEMAPLSNTATATRAGGEPPSVEGVGSLARAPALGPAGSRARERAVGLIVGVLILMAEVALAAFMEARDPTLLDAIFAPMFLVGVVWALCGEFISSCRHDIFP